MGPSQQMLWKLYAGALGAGATLLTTKVVNSAWKAVTGDDPGDPNDPDTPITQAIMWALASGLGIGISRMMVNRFTARRWKAAMGADAPNFGKVNFKL